MFNFIVESKTSGQITLLDRNEFYPGETGEVEIAFPDREYLGENFSEGTKFTFDEGFKTLGEGEILEIIERDA